MAASQTSHCEFHLASPFRRRRRLQFITEYLVKAWLQCGKKIYLDFCPLGQGDIKCCLLRIYLRFSRTIIAQGDVRRRWQFITEYLVKAWLQCGKKIYLDFCPIRARRYLVSTSIQFLFFFCGKWGIRQRYNQRVSFEAFAEIRVPDRGQRRSCLFKKKRALLVEEYSFLFLRKVRDLLAL